MFRMVVLVFLSTMLAACVTTTTEPHTFAPADRWIKLQGDSDTLFSTLESVRPAPGVSDEEHTEWMAGLTSSLPRPGEWALHLGVADVNSVLEAGFTPFLGYGADPLTVTKICLQTSSCVSCIHTATTKGKNPPKPENTYKGICTTLSTAYSLVYILSKRTEFGDLGTMKIKNKKKYWKKGFLDSIRKDQEHDASGDGGTPRDKIKKAYERYGCQCTAERSIANAGGAEKWKRELKKKLEGDTPADCHLIVDGNKDGKSWAHDMHVDGFTDSGNIAVADTGMQGSGSGEDAPVVGVAGAEEWGVTTGPGGTQVTCEKSADKDWWNNETPTNASYICCTCP